MDGGGLKVSPLSFPSPPSVHTLCSRAELFPFSLTSKTIHTMYSTLFTTTLFFALAALRVAAEFTVYTPELIQVSNFSTASSSSQSLISSRLGCSANPPPLTGITPMAITMSSSFPPTIPAVTNCTCSPYGFSPPRVFSLTKPRLSADLGDIETNTYQWSKVTIPAGTSVMISVLDTDGQEGWSGAVSRSRN